MTEQEFEDLRRVEDAFNEAMVSNDVRRIEDCVTDDWVLVTPAAGIVTRARILGAIGSGVLSHDSMTKEVQRVCVYGDMAVVTGRAGTRGCFVASRSRRTSGSRTSTGADGRWRCVLTHLTPVASPQG